MKQKPVRDNLHHSLRSFRSFKSLSTFSSKSCASHYETSFPRGIRNDKTELYLHASRSTAAENVQRNGSFHRRERKTYSLEGLPNQDNSILFLFLMLLAVDLNLPTCLIQVLHSLELEPNSSQSVSALIFLGLCSGIILKATQKTDYNPRHTPSVNNGVVVPDSSALICNSSSQSSLASIGNLYQWYHDSNTNCACQYELLQPKNVRSVCDESVSSTDEWGHFADFIETIEDADSPLLFATMSKSCLPPLRECDLEED